MPQRSDKYGKPNKQQRVAEVPYKRTLIESINPRIPRHEMMRSGKKSNQALKITVLVGGISMLTSVGRVASLANSRSMARGGFSLSQHRGCAFWPFAWPRLPGSPTFYHTTWDRDFDPYVEEDNNPEIPRNEFGVPAHIPPEIGQSIKHTFHVPPQYYPFLKKLGDDTPELKPYTDMLINGELTYEKYEEMFYKFAKPLKIYRSRIPQPYRTDPEIAQQDSVAWEGAWYSFRQRILADYYTQFRFRDHLVGALIGLWIGAIMVDQHRQYRVDMKLYYLEAPEHKINWVKPRGDL